MSVIPKFDSLKQKVLFISQSLWVRNWEWLGWLALAAGFHEVTAKLSAGDAVPKGLMDGHLLPNPDAYWQASLLAGFRLEISVASLWASPRAGECLCDVAQFPQNK